ncbi:hypothetical protein ACLMJK_006498 [Lecanora helva]
MFLRQIVGSSSACCLLFSFLSSASPTPLDPVTRLSDSPFDSLERRAESPVPSLPTAQETNHSNLNFSTTDSTHQLNDHPFIWEVTDDLSLTIHFGPWRLAQDKVIATLEAAEEAVGKKRAAALLEEKFVQKTGSRLNAMVFELSPGDGERKLTWADVGAVVSGSGLPGFFRQEGHWLNLEFEVFDSLRGEIGQGTIRKWYHIGFDVGNGTLSIGNGHTVT